MQGLFWETDTSVRMALRALVVLIGFWTAWRAGRAMAEGWRGYGAVVLCAFGLGIMMRFLHFALFEGPFLSLELYCIDLTVLLVFSIAGFQVRRTSQMTSSYYWLYERSSPFSWRRKA